MFRARCIPRRFIWIPNECSSMFVDCTKLACEYSAMSSAVYLPSACCFTIYLLKKYNDNIANKIIAFHTAC